MVESIRLLQSLHQLSLFFVIFTFLEEFSLQARRDLRAFFGVGFCREFRIDDEGRELGQLAFEEVKVVLRRLKAIARRSNPRVAGEGQFDDPIGCDDLCERLRF